MITKESSSGESTTFFGLSSDAKPVDGTKNGNAFIEMDTGKVYFFDAANSQWREFA